MAWYCMPRPSTLNANSLTTVSLPSTRRKPTGVYQTPGISIYAFVPKMLARFGPAVSLAVRNVPIAPSS